VSRRFASVLPLLGVLAGSRAEAQPVPELDVRDGPDAASGCTSAAAVAAEGARRAPMLEQGVDRAWRDAWFSLDVQETSPDRYRVRLVPMRGEAAMAGAAGTWETSSGDCPALAGHIAERAWSWLQTLPDATPERTAVKLSVAVGPERGWGQVAGSVRVEPVSRGRVGAWVGVRAARTSESMVDAPSLHRPFVGVTAGLRGRPSAQSPWQVGAGADLGVRWARQGGATLPFPGAQPGWPGWLAAHPRAWLERDLGDRWCIGAEAGARVPRLASPGGWVEAPGWAAVRIGAAVLPF
jgi:hypothetical protein